MVGTADKSRPDVNRVYGITGNHGFSYDPNGLPYFNPSITNTIEIRAVDYQTGDLVDLGTKSIGPCTCPAGTIGTPPSCPTVSSICPENATFDIANVKVNLDDKTPNPQTTPSNYTSTSSTDTRTAYQYVKKSKTAVTSIGDVSTGGSRITVDKVSESYGKVTLNYTKFVKAYPYDKNQASVTYDSYYDKRTYKSKLTGSYYDCGGGVHQASKTCTGSEPAYCPAGYTVSGSYCYDNQMPQVGGTCPSGWYKSGSSTTCYHWTGYTLQCSRGTLSGTTCKYTYDGTLTYTYAYSLVSTLADQKVSNTVNAPLMDACRYRNFSVDSVTPSADLSPDYEDPTSGTASATAHITFSLDSGVPGGLRTDYTLNGVSYTAIFTSGCAGSFSGSFNATAPKSTGQADPTVGSGSCGLSPPVPLGTQVCVDFSVRPAFGKVDEDGNIETPNGGNKTGDNCSRLVQNEPYLKVFGGDVLAGAGFTSGATCLSPGNSQILGWNKNDGGGYTHGSGTEFAAYAISHIKQFATAQGGGVIAAGPPSGLAFANNPRPAGDYGGNLAGAGCIPDYFSGRTGSNLPGMEISALSDRTYSAPGSVGTSGMNGLRGTVHSGEQVTVYVNGNVYISGNIDYAPAAQVTDMPSFTLVANGNIYISDKVTRLDGNYIAQNGKIYDCAQANGIPYAQSDIYSKCQNKLTVNGTFVSDRTLFLRTGANGSLRFSGSDTGPGNNNASEEFNYTPALWMAPPANNSQPPAYDSITSLPPIL